MAVTHISSYPSVNSVFHVCFIWSKSIRRWLDGRLRFDIVGTHVLFQHDYANFKIVVKKGARTFFNLRHWGFHFWGILLFFFYKLHLLLFTNKQIKLKGELRPKTHPNFYGLILMVLWTKSLAQSFVVF